MTAKLLKKSFDKYYSFPPGFWESVAGLGDIITAGKEQTIKKADQTEQYLYFIIEGSGGILLWNKNNFVCSDLLMENDFICDYLSFITRRPTPYEVLTFEKSTLFRVAYSDLSRFLDENPYGEKFWRYATQALYIDKHNQYIQAFTESAAVIYKKILMYEPDIVKRIPQKFIASFLGVTPQSLSRIRNEI
jgi:CRP-like cAMP-binding protein